jgi:hypothetical protein
MPIITNPSAALNRAKRADLTSGVGALFLGLGIAALFPRVFGAYAVEITIVGALLHAFGMWDKHRMEVAGPELQLPWVNALYWVCWFMLAALVLVIAIR